MREPVVEPTDVKRQHYVPRTYLQFFADEKDQITVVDLQPPGGTFRTSVINAAVESRFYDFETQDEVVSSENWLSQLEGDAAPVLQKLVADPDNLLQLPDVEEVLLSRFLAAFRFRTPRFREQLKILQAQMVAFAKDLGRAWLRNT